MTDRYDVIVVGASVAGSTAASELAAAGRSVLLLDRAVFPRDKPCGEGVMPTGAALLEKWGIRPRGARPFHGIRFRHGRRILESKFARGQQGLCVRRSTLDHDLVRRAESVPGVTFREGFRVERVLHEGDTVVGVAGEDGTEYRAPITLGCDGARSVFHTACGFEKKFHPRLRYGVSGHVRASVGPVVEIVFFDGGQVFIGPCGEGEASATLLLDKGMMGRFAGRPEEAYVETLKSAGCFGRNPQPTTPVMVTGPLGFTIRPIWRPGLLLVGDSAGFFDPITGEGMSAAMVGACLAVRTILEKTPPERYAAEYAALLRDITRLTGFLLRVTRKPGAVDRALDRLLPRPELLEKLLGITSGSNRWKDLTMRERFYLGTGI